MPDGTHIEWTDATWNPITGCSVVSPGCANCYAMRLAGTRLKHSPTRAGLTRDSKAGPVWNGEVRLNEQWLDQPLRWQRPRRIFVCAHGDLFHESVPDAWIDRVFAVMALAPQHTFQVLTKRAARMREYFAGIEREQIRRRHETTLAPYRFDDVVAEITESCCYTLDETAWPLPNVWLGVSVEDQQRADERIPHLLATPAAKRFISAEPLLGLVDLRFLQPSDPPVEIDALAGTHGVVRPHGGRSPRLDWVIAGGESGPGARPMHPDWVRSLRDQCTDVVPFFFKQWGEWTPGENTPNSRRTLETASLFDDRWTFDTQTASQGEKTHRDDEPDVFRVGKKAAGATLDGREWREMPA